MKLHALLFCVALATFAGCGTGPVKCDSSSCFSGCCDATGACQAAAALTCGSNGGLCNACLIGQSCVLGQCSTGTGTGGAGGGTTGGGTGGGTAIGGGAGGGTATGGGAGGGTATGGGTGGGIPTGGGTGGGTPNGGGTGGGTPTGGGTGGGLSTFTTIQAARAATPPVKVTLQGVVVTAISFARASTSSTCPGLSTPGVNASFWVADPANPQAGLWVDKFRCDAAADYFPQVGDVLSISGIISTESAFRQQEGYRTSLQSEFDSIPNKPVGYSCAATSVPPCEPLVITRTSTRTPLPTVNVPTTFGSGGGIQAEPSYVGARVKIAGPLTVMNVYPTALRRLSALPGDTRSFGYQLSNGVLVNNFRTFDGAMLENGVVSRCDVRNVVLDGGTVTFPNGLIGVWDTYTHATCVDGGINLNNCFNNTGMVPGTTANLTHVLHPTDCADQAP